MTNEDPRSPDEIERDIKRTQNEMSRTVDQLGDQFTMRNLVNSLFDKAEGGDIEARQMLDIARRNPLALGLLSIGGIWLVSDYDAHPRTFTSNSSDDDQGDLPTLDTSYERDHTAYVQHMAAYERRENEADIDYQRRRDDARGTFLMLERRHEENDSDYRQRLDEATDAMRERRDQMAEKARQARDEAGTRLRQAKGQMQSSARRGANRVSGMYQDNPLIGGMAAALVGMIAGSAAPATQREREAFGDTGEQLLENAKQQAHVAGEKAKAKKDELVEKADEKVSPNTPRQTSDNASDNSATETASTRPATRPVVA